MATYDREEVQKVVFGEPSEGGCGGGQCGPPPDVHYVPIGESPKPEGGDEGGDDQGQDQIFKEAQDILDAMKPSDEPVSCGSIDASMDKQEGDLDLEDSIDADEAIKQIEDEVAKKGGDKHPFRATEPGTGEGGGDYVIALPEIQSTPAWVRLIREFAEKDFDKVKGKKEFDAPFSFAYGFVQRGKVRAPEFRQHMYIMADVSGSMMGGVVGEGDTLLEELLAFIPKLTEDYSIELWFVSNGLLKKENGDDAIYTPRELEDMNNEEFAKWLVEKSQEVPMGGGTSFDQPFEQMLEERKESDTEGVVVALTDTDFRTKPIPKNTMIITDKFNKPILDARYKNELKDEELNFHIIDFKEEGVDDNY